MKELKSYQEMIEGGFAETFARFRTLLLDYNQRCNLTSVTDEREILYKHFLDSVAGENLFPHGARVAEVGSGAGFPSIPLKIVRDDLSFTLFESIGKKCDFLSFAIRELNFSGMEVRNLRAEDGGREEKYRERYDVCCARAVARLNTLAEYCLPLVKVGGRFIAYKGPAEEEVKEAERAIETLGGKLKETVKFSLPENAGERTLVVIEKIRKTPQKYPRGRGKERSAPIV